MLGVDEEQSQGTTRVADIPFPPLPPTDGAAIPSSVLKPPPIPAHLRRPEVAKMDAPTSHRAVAPKKQTRTRWIVAAVVGVLLITVVGSAVFVGRQLSGLTFIENVEQGECVEDFFAESADGEFVEIFFVTTVDCAQPHAYEVYASTNLLWGDEPYPGVESAFVDGERFCNEQFESFTGTEYFSSPYEFLTFVPTTEMWETGDRTVRCLIGNADGITLKTGTLSDVGELVVS